MPYCSDCGKKLTKEPTGKYSWETGEPLTNWTCKDCDDKRDTSLVLLLIGILIVVGVSAIIVFGASS